MLCQIMLAKPRGTSHALNGAACAADFDAPLLFCTLRLPRVSFTSTLLATWEFTNALDFGARALLGRRRLDVHRNCAWQHFLLPCSWLH